MYRGVDIFPLFIARFMLRLSVLELKSIDLHWGPEGHHPASDWRYGSTDLYRRPELNLSIHVRQPTTACNSRSRRFAALFRILQAPALMCVHLHIYTGRHMPLK